MTLLDPICETLTDDTYTESTAMSNTQQKTDTIKVTNPFGTFEFDESQIIAIPRGMMGFPEYTRYALGKMGHINNNDFLLLQCLDKHDLAFIVFPTTAQNPLIEQDDVQQILLDYQIQEDALALLHIATLHKEDGKEVEMTLNLKAPIILDAASQEAEQHVLIKSHYNTRFSPKGLAA